MLTHVNHPSSLEHGLADGCKRCAELAAEPVKWLDSEHLASAWRLMLRVEYGHPPLGTAPDHYRSDAEAKCCRVLQSHAEFLLTIGVNPRDVMPGRHYAREI